MEHRNTPPLTSHKRGIFLALATREAKPKRGERKPGGLRHMHCKPAETWRSGFQVLPPLVPAFPYVYLSVQKVYANLFKKDSRYVQHAVKKYICQETSSSQV